MVFIVSRSVIGACRRYRQQQHCLTYSTAGVINLATGAIAFFVAERLSYPVSAHHWALTGDSIVRSDGPAQRRGGVFATDTGWTCFFSIPAC